jgi:class 3 adenylate cyclase/pimeloyl-ACP methyl ester carboxylesterase
VGGKSLREEERRLAAVLAADVAGYSRLMAADEPGTLSQLRKLRAEVFEPKVTEFHGRIVGSAGDSLLIEFASAVNAVQCAVEIQQRLRDQNASLPENKRMAFRIGVNLGDVIAEADTIHGDCVNVASRLEKLSEHGGVCIGHGIHDQVKGKLPYAYDDLGEQRFHNIPEPVRAYRVSFDRPIGAPASAQTIRFCAASDGVNLAYATVGSGPPIVMGASWLTHLEFDWQNPYSRHYFSLLSRDHMLIRYDPRGSGLSDWDVADISFEAFVADMATVIDAVGTESFPVFAMSQAVSVAIAYSVRHPGRVSKLILCGGYARGRRKRGSAREVAESDALITLIEKGWGSDNPAFRQMLTSIFLPDATDKEVSYFNKLQKISTNAANAVRFRRVFDDFDVTGLLDQISVPTLVLHSRNDAAAPLQESRILASRIHGARFVALESNNHFLLENEPAWPTFVREVKAFLAS